MGYFDKIAELGLMVVCRRNMLGTTTMFAVRPDECAGKLDLLLDLLPEWRVVDFVGDDAQKGAQMLYQKLTCTGEYATFDGRLGGRNEQISFGHRNESDRFQPVG